MAQTTRDNIPQGFQKTEVGVIPEDWEIRSIGEIASIIGGGTPSSFKNKYWNGNINWFTPTEIGDKKYASESNRKITKEGFKNCSAKMLPKGTILLTSRAGIGNTAILLKEACTNQGFQSLVVQLKTNNEFVYYVVNSITDVFIKNASGSTFLEISPKKIKQILIPLPPTLAEQTAIANALSDMDALIDAQDKLIHKKRLIKQGAMQELLRPKEGWVEKKLGDITKLKNGYSFKSEYFTNKGPIVITPGNFQIQGGLKFHNKNTIRYSGMINQEMQIKKGDLLIVMTDLTPSCNLLGKPGIINTNEVILHNQRIGKIIITNNIIHKSFLYYFFSSQIFSNRMKKTATGSTVRHTSASTIRNTIINFPELNHQQRIAQTLSDMDTEIEQLETQLTKYKQMKTGMMQELLTGKKRLNLDLKD